MNTIKKRILSRATDNSEKGHTNEILCLALSDDFKFLVSNHFLSKFYFIYLIIVQKRRPRVEIDRLKYGTQSHASLFMHSKDIEMPFL